MAIRYFAMKHVSKPRDYSSNKQDSSSKPQDTHSKHGKQSDRQPDRQPDRQHEKQQDRQHDRQPDKSKCSNCGRSHPGACHTNTSNSSNPTSKHGISTVAPTILRPRTRPDSFRTKPERTNTSKLAIINCKRLRELAQ
jgi:hypothetical protein